VIDPGGYKVFDLGETYFVRRADEQREKWTPVPLTEVSPILVSELIATVKTLEALSTIPPPPPPTPKLLSPLPLSADDLIPF
jgi:hypothetical protein